MMEGKRRRLKARHHHTNYPPLADFQTQDCCATLNIGSDCEEFREFEAGPVLRFGLDVHNHHSMQVAITFGVATMIEAILRIKQLPSAGSEKGRQSIANEFGYGPQPARLQWRQRIIQSSPIIRTTQIQRTNDPG